jgi:hypothetical protein
MPKGCVVLVKNGNTGEFLLRGLADSGQLADHYAAADEDGRRQLCEAAFPIVEQLVFGRITRRLEHARGHHACATSVWRLRPECMDRHLDDVEAALDDLFRKARVPIANLEGWLVGRLNAATVDAHRRRRGARGALQKVRPPQWLINGLGGDAWLTTLAHDILVWVGLEATAGTELWPIDAWVERRAGLTGDVRADERVVRQDIETVLRVMRGRPKWHEAYVERPLGHKQTPVRPISIDSADSVASERSLPLVGRHDIDESRLLDVASLALDAMMRRIERGEDPRTVVSEVVRMAFRDGTADGLDRAPGTSSVAERAAELVADQAVVDRVVATVLGLLGPAD